MLEIHLYFTPLLTPLEAFDQNDWYLHPVVNINAAKALRDQENFPKTVHHLNACFDRSEKIALDFLIINLHGRKYGRKFILKLQDNLQAKDILTYNHQMRNQILHDIGLSATDFKVFRNFGKQELSKSLHDFYNQKFLTTPASIILTDQEEFHLESCDFHHFKQFLNEIKKTA